MASVATRTQLSAAYKMIKRYLDSWDNAETHVSIMFTMQLWLLYR